MAGDDRQTRRVVLGALLIIALVGSAFLVFVLDSLIEGLRDEYEIVAVVSQAPGITAGSAVWLGGVEVGSVSEVGFLPSPDDTVARLALTLKLPVRLQQQVREDSRVRFASARLIGERAVDIIPGSAVAPVLAPGDTIRQQQMATVAELTATAAAVRAGLDTVIIEFQELTPAITVALDRTRTAFAGMELAMAEARMLQSDLQSSPAMALLEDAEFRASLERARSHIGALPDLLGQLGQRTNEAREVGPALARLRMRADSLRAQLTDVARMIDYPNGSAARFSQDTALARALQHARTELDSLMADVRQNPLRYIR